MPQKKKQKQFKCHGCGKRVAWGSTHCKYCGISFDPNEKFALMFGKYFPSTSNVKRDSDGYLID